MSSKDALRKQMKTLRASILPRDRVQKSKQVFENLKQNERFKNAPVVAFYLSFGTEVTTDFMIEWCIAQGKKVLVPKMLRDKIILLDFESFDTMEMSLTGVREPVMSIPSTLSPEVILVPGLAFDKENHRLGYGGGHYDRFLKTKSAFAIGLAFKEQVVEKLPSEPHDVVLSAVVTD